jgi:hypothetical protein
VANLFFEGVNFRLSFGRGRAAKFVAVVRELTVLKLYLSVFAALYDQFITSQTAPVIRTKITKKVGRFDLIIGQPMTRSCIHCGMNHPTTSGQS